VQHQRDYDSGEKKKKKKEKKRKEERVTMLIETLKALGRHPVLAIPRLVSTLSMGTGEKGPSGDREAG
jgi:hypothetical protein